MKVKLWLAATLFGSAIVCIGCGGGGGAETVATTGTASSSGDASASGSGGGSSSGGGGASSTSTSSSSGGGSMPICGDGAVDPGEDCDGSALSGADCVAQGF